MWTSSFENLYDKTNNKGGNDVCEIPTLSDRQS